MLSLFNDLIVKPLSRSGLRDAHRLMVLKSHSGTPCHDCIPLDESNVERIHLLCSHYCWVHPTEAHNMMRRLGVSARPEREGQSEPDVRIAESGPHAASVLHNVFPLVFHPLHGCRSLALVGEYAREP